MEGSPPTRRYGDRLTAADTRGPTAPVVTPRKWDSQYLLRAGVSVVRNKYTLLVPAIGHSSSIRVRVGGNQAF